MCISRGEVCLLHNLKNVSTKNEYGNTDLTAFNAIKKMENPSYEIKIGGKKYLGQRKYYLSKTEILKKAGELLNKPIHRNTLLSWERQGLIPVGIKEGRDKLYPPETPFEILGPFFPGTVLHRRRRFDARLSMTIDYHVSRAEFLVTTSDILSQDYDKAIRKHHWIQRVINFGMPSSNQHQDSSSSVYLFDRIQPTLRAKVECEAKLVKRWSTYHDKSKVINILSSGREVEDFKNKIFAFYGVQVEKFLNVVGSPEVNKNFNKMIDMSDELA